jgi:DNA-binding beta-propeller fold protein YncE
MMCPVRRPTVAFAGLALFASALATGAGATAGAAGAADPASTAVHTVLGPGVLDGPGGIAFDAAGDLFIADTGHCRILVVPARPGILDGLHVRAGRASTLAGGSCTGQESLGHPSDVAVDRRGDVFVAEATAQRVQEVRAGARTVMTVAGTGRAGVGVGGPDATTSELDEPTGVAVDAAGDLFIADTASCRVLVVPAVTGALFGQAVRAGDLSTVAGTGVCGSAGRGGPPLGAQLWDPVAVAFDAAGDLLVADSGDQSVLLAPSGSGGTFYGSTVGAGDIGVVMGGTGSYGPYVADGLPANGPTAELNDPRGLAVGPTGALFVTDGFMHVIRVVPAASETLFGTAMKAGDLYTVAGALPVATAAGTNNGTKWVRTRMGTPVGVAVNATGALVYADATQDTVRVIGAGAGSS